MEPEVSGSHSIARVDRGGAKIQILHMSEYLAEYMGDLKLGNGDDVSVTFQDPCRLGRHLGIYDAPRRVIERLGVELIEMPRHRDNSLCCGTNGWTHCEIANKAIQVDRLREAKTTGADLLVTADHGLLIDGLLYNAGALLNNTTIDVVLPTTAEIDLSRASRRGSSCGVRPIGSATIAGRAAASSLTCPGASERVASKRWWPGLVTVSWQGPGIA